MNTRRILLLLISIGTCALIGSFLLDTILLVSPKENKDVVEAVVSSNKAVAVAFFGFLGAVIAVLKNQGVKTGDVEHEPSADPDPLRDEDVDSAKRLRSISKRAEALEGIARNNRHVAIRALSYKAAVLVAIQFALAYPTAAVIEGFIQKAFPPATLSGLAFFLVAFAQSEIALVCAIVIPYRQYQSFLREANYSAEATTALVISRVGAQAIFFCGVVSLVMLSPEQLALLLSFKDLRAIPVFGMNYLLFLAISRLLVFPLVALGACYLALRYLTNPVGTVGSATSANRAFATH